MNTHVPTIILVVGLPGSGKTFFAKRLSEALGALHISSDAVRKDLHATGRYQIKDKIAVYHEAARIAAKEISMSRSVVVDATFHHHSMRDIFTHLALEYSCHLRFILIEAPEPLIAKRLEKKRADSEADMVVYHKLKSQYETLTVPHLVLESKEDNVDSMVKAALEYLEAYDQP